MYLNQLTQGELGEGELIADACEFKVLLENVTEITLELVEVM